MKQEKNERVQVFSVRLREALNKLILQFPDQVPARNNDRILCDHFFYGMKGELKSSVRHLFDSHEVSFSTLLTAARRNELEELEQKPVRVQSRATKIGIEEKVSPQTESINDLKEQIQELIMVMKSGSVTHKPNPLAINKGHVRRVCPSCLNIMRGKCKNHSSPKSGVHRDSDPNNRGEPVMAKVVKMADRYHNPDPLI